MTELSAWFAFFPPFPTGELFKQLLAAGVKAVGTGFTIFRRDLIEKEDYDGIRTLAQMHVDAVKLTQL